MDESPCGMDERKRNGRGQRFSLAAEANGRLLRAPHCLPDHAATALQPLGSERTRTPADSGPGNVPTAPRPSRRTTVRFVVAPNHPRTKNLCGVCEERAVEPSAPILIVDDDEDIREALHSLLELEGYTVLSAANGREALELLSRSPRPGLILLDLMMPLMNGWEFKQAAAKNPALASIPVVIVTAFPGRLESLNAAGALIKPIEMDALIAVARRFCASRS
jgi:CheY-like chemotaxis protein